MYDSKEKSKRRDLRADILETALRLFADRGYAATSVHDIRKAARVSIGAVYHHFENKEAIARALHGWFTEKLTGALQDIADRHQTAHDRCLAAIAYLFALSESFPEATAFYLFPNHRDFLPEGQTLFSSPPFARLQQMVEQGIADGEIRSMPPRVAVAALFGGPLQMIRLLVEGDIQPPLMPSLENVWDCAWRAVAR
jgi:AcrR family transcriptional regulator